MKQLVAVPSLGWQPRGATSERGLPGPPRSFWQYPDLSVIDKVDGEGMGRWTKGMYPWGGNSQRWLFPRGLYHQEGGTASGGCSSKGWEAYRGCCTHWGSCSYKGWDACRMPEGGHWLFVHRLGSLQGSSTGCEVCRRGAIPPGGGTASAGCSTLYLFLVALYVPSRGTPE